jgi:hypothetical protein
MMKKCAVMLGFFLVLFAGFRSRAQSQNQGQILVVQGGTLIDGTGRTPVKDAVIVIEGNRIKEVGAKGKVTIPPNARIINADGRTILPGFIDTQAQGNWEWQPPLWLHFGVTTVYYNGTPYMYAEKELQEQGKLKGPRMFLTAGFVNPAIELMRPDSKKDIEKPWPIRTSMRSRGVLGSARAPLRCMSPASANALTSMATGRSTLGVMICPALTISERPMGSLL